jgi:hypothetical protein
MPAAKRSFRIAVDRRSSVLCTRFRRDMVRTRNDSLVSERSRSAGCVAHAAMVKKVPVVANVARKILSNMVLSS